MNSDDRSLVADDSSSIGDDQEINVQELVDALVESDSETPLGDSPQCEAPLGDTPLHDEAHDEAPIGHVSPHIYEGHDVPLPADSDDDEFGEENPDAAEQEVSGGSGEEEKPKRKPISFGTHSPPPLRDARKHTSILASGKFTKGYNQFFVNSARKTQNQGQNQDEEEEQDDGVAQFRGMVFTGTGGGSRAQSSAAAHEGSTYGGSQYGGSRYGGNRYGGGKYGGNKYGGEGGDYQGRSYQRNYNGYNNYNNYNNYNRRPYNNYRSHNRIDYEDVLNAQDAQEMLSRNARWCLNDKVGSYFLNQHQYAIPETLAWKFTTGKFEAHFDPNSVCPGYKKREHYEFTADELAAEKYRVNLLYKLICEHGILHVEDLYREYLRMNVMEPYPFDGFNHFHKFIADRAHIFGMDQKDMVYNENLLVTLAVMRYAHALLHETPVERAPKLFKAETGGLFYRAFLAYMSKDELSFDTFFQHFPAIFVFDEVWSLNEESAAKIPCAFLADCVPERDTTKIYVDRSQLFSGVGVVHANNIMHIKIQSEECLRKNMPYFVSMPIALVDDPEKYPVGSRVAYTAVRMYNDIRDTVQGTSIRMEPVERTRDGIIPDFWSFIEEVEGEGNEENFIDLNDEKKPAKETVTLDETRDDSTVRTLDLRATIAEREHKRQEVMLRLAKNGIEVNEMGKEVLSLFPYGYADYVNYLEKRPFLFDVLQREDDKAMIIKSRPASVRKAIQDYVCSLAGKDGRSVSKAEAIEMCAAVNEFLSNEDRFTFEDLKGCLRIDRLLITNDEGKREFKFNVEPLFYWNWQHKIMMCM